jgi:hypothetical protein
MGGEGTVLTCFVEAPSMIAVGLSHSHPIFTAANHRFLLGNILVPGYVALYIRYDVVRLALPTGIVDGRQSLLCVFFFFFFAGPMYVPMCTPYLSRAEKLSHTFKD